MKKKRKLPQYECAYTVMDELLASPTEPLQAEKRTYQLTRIYQGLHEIEQGENPTPEDWRLVSNAVNLVETLIREMKVCDDNAGLLHDAIAALAKAGTRHKRGGSLRLDGEGIKAVRAILDDYASLLNMLPARTMVRCHRLTERRIIGLIKGKTRTEDVVV
jgi:hypothetical protein